MPTHYHDRSDSHRHPIDGPDGAIAREIASLRRGQRLLLDELSDLREVVEALGHDRQLDARRPRRVAA